MSPRRPDDPGAGRGRRRDPDHGPEVESRRRRLRSQPAAYDNELHYGEANRRRAREFLGRNENAVADRPGRRWARGPDGGAGAPPPVDIRWAPDD
ncbi:MAG TPA: hypothetical protein VFZ77_16825, partial [Acidimicrobiales bacterium]